ncbi:unnamed protein product [Dicrocoelium dendriticum]|nr:unnamed protein product [Dicrocoelium dendriticum]
MQISCRVKGMYLVFVSISIQKIRNLRAIHGTLPTWLSAKLCERCPLICSSKVHGSIFIVFLKFCFRYASSLTFR